MNGSEITTAMFSDDAFSQWLGITFLQQADGYCRLQMTVREEMCNGFGIAHGGITYSLADSALAFASNSRGHKALSIQTSIAHLHPVHPGDVIIATAFERTLTARTALYDVDITLPDGKLVATFRGTVYRKSQHW